MNTSCPRGRNLRVKRKMAKYLICDNSHDVDSSNQYKHLARSYTGGFNLTKVGSNKLEVMQLTPEKHMRKNVKLKKLETSNSVSERAL